MRVSEVLKAPVAEARARGRICLRYARRPKGSGANRRVWLDLARENFRRAAALTLPVRDSQAEAFQPRVEVARA